MKKKKNNIFYFNVHSNFQKNNDFFLCVDKNNFNSQ